MSFAVLPLSRDSDRLFCLIDAEDYEWIKAHVWNTGWFGHRKHRLYAKRNIGRDRATVWLHREIMKRIDPRPDEFVKAHIVDHVNNVSLDNRRANLRWAMRALRCCRTF